MFVHHLFVRRLLDNLLALHVLRSSVDLFEVLCDYLLHLLAILEDLRVLSLYFPLDSGYDWVAPFDPEDLVRDLVKLFQFSIP